MLTAIIWGSAFVAQRECMDEMGPLFFSALRMFLGSLTLLPIIWFLDRHKARSNASNGVVISEEQKQAARKTLLRGGVACGVIIFFAANLQQLGLVSVSAGKTGFITTLYIILVPLFGILLKHRPNLFNWIGVVLGTAGLYFLCITEAFSIAFGDLVVLIGAVFWAFHILCIDHYAPKVDVTKLICLQFLISGIMSLAAAFLMGESFTLHSVTSSIPNILYAGVLSSAVAFTFQGLGQKHANPTAASIILSTESLFAALAGFLILNEVFTSREFVGCVLMFAAVIIAQLPTKAERETLREQAAAAGTAGAIQAPEATREQQP